MKQCTKCGIKKQLKEFPKAYDGRKGGREAACKVCRATKRRERWKHNKQNNKTKFTENNRKWQLKSMYGITKNEYDSLLEQTNGHCPICNKRFAMKKGVSKHGPVVDHNHSNGKIRGIVCSLCNVGLGYFQDNPEVLQNAINYLNCNSYTAP